MNLNQISIPSSDLELSVSFYKKLGLRLIVDSIPHYARFVCSAGSTTFSIHQTDKPAAEDGITVYFECENLDDQVEDLIRKGISFDEMPNDKPWLWREASLRDPDGNRLILFYAGENRLNPPWRVHPS